MRHFTKIIFLWGLLLIPAFSCEQNVSLATVDAEDAEIDFQFRLLNEDGVPATTFRYGENFVFSFLIINNTDLHLRFLQSSLDNSEFFKVYTLKSSSTENETEIGKPYSVIFCDKVGGIPVPSNDTLKLEIPWMPEWPWQPEIPYYSSNFCLIEDNSCLASGKYRTGFSSSFGFFYGEESFVTETKQFHIEFEIK